MKQGDVCWYTFRAPDKRRLREMLADHLLASLDSANQKKIDAAWAEEIERRVREIDEGKVEMIDGEQVMRELRERHRR